MMTIFLRLSGNDFHCKNSTMPKRPQTYGKCKMPETSPANLAIIKLGTNYSVFLNSNLEIL